MRRFLALGVGILATAALTSGCTPSSGHPPAYPGATPAPAYYDAWHTWAWDAIEVEFAPLGASQVRCAHAVADHESGHNPTSEEPAPDPHHGLFQLQDGFWGSIVATANRLGRAPNWHDPRQNAGAAEIEVRQHGWHNDWAGSAPGWCP